MTANIFNFKFSDFFHNFFVFKVLNSQKLPFCFKFYFILFIIKMKTFFELIFIKILQKYKVVCYKITYL